MKMTAKEKAIQNYMVKLKISREEAEELYNDDNSDTILPSVKEMEKNAKANGRQYVSTGIRKPVQRERKVDEKKGKILQSLIPVLNGLGCQVTATKTETEISFTLDGESYGLKLTKHRK